MKVEIKSIGVLTSGGDAPGMNAAVRAVVRACAYHKKKCFGIYHGYQGLIDGELKILAARSVSNIIHKGGTMLKSARCEVFKTQQGRTKAFNMLKENKIDALVVIGGDGSFAGALALHDESNIPVVGIPSTIDNDIAGTNYTIGYDTALNTVVEAIDKIRDTASSHNRLFFVEVMGRDAGHIALNAGIAAGAGEILIPEEDMGLNRLLKSLKAARYSGKTSNIVVVAEGDKTGKNVFRLAKSIRKDLPDYDVRVSVLGHIQRGGRPSCFDRLLASRMGVFAVDSLLNGSTKDMTGIVDNKIKLSPLKGAIKGKLTINKNLIRVSDIISA